MSNFEDSIRGVERESASFHRALVETNDTVEYAKKILLNNKVQNFTAADVVALTGMIIARQQFIIMGESHD